MSFPSFSLLLPSLDPSDTDGLAHFRLGESAYAHRRALSSSASPLSAPLPHADWTTAATSGLFPGLSLSSSAPPISTPTSMLSQLMLPGDAVKGGAVRGGIVLKIMDSAAGIVAWRHCRTNVVTVSVEAMDMLRPVMVGSVLVVRASLCFLSARYEKEWEWGGREGKRGKGRVKREMGKWECAMCKL